MDYPIIDDGFRREEFDGFIFRTNVLHVLDCQIAIRKRWKQEASHSVNECYGELAHVVKLNTRKRKNNSSV